MTGEGKDFVIKKAQEAVTGLFQQIGSLLSPTSRAFLGTVSADHTYITDDATGDVYNLVFMGSPQPKSLAYIIDNQTAYVKGVDFVNQQLWQNNNIGYILSKDSTWFYIRKLGSADKYYLPYASVLKNRDMSSAQAMFSSDGKAVLVGTVLENLDGDFTSDLIYHQIARYAIFPNIKLVDFTSGALASASLSTDGLDYPVVIDSGAKIAWCDVTALKDIAFNCNTMTDTFVPPPEARVYSARGMFFPYAKALNLYYQFLAFVNQNWFETSGDFQLAQSADPHYILGVDFYAKRYTSGVQNFTWKSPKANNTSLFKNFQYTFNNDLQGIYDADLVLTHVNCYFFGMTQMDWFTEFYHEYLGVIVSCTGCDTTGTYGDRNYYFENYKGLYSYTIPIDYAYTLHYFQTPDVWLPINVSSTTGAQSWIKNGQERSWSSIVYPDTSNPTSGQYDSLGAIVFDALKYAYAADPNTYLTYSGINGYDGYSLAYTSTQTLGPPFGGRPYANPDAQGRYETLYANYYSGLQRIYENAYNYIWPGYSIWFAQQVPPIFIDLNYDNLFQAASPAYDAIFAGRSTSVIKSLGSTPILYGIITQLLSDGADFNNLYYAYRGRDFADFNKTAYVYKQDFNKVYRYSTPDLQQGNLSGIPGTGKADLADQAASDPYGTGIANLVDALAITDVYGDTATSHLIQTAIAYYRNQQIPTQAMLNAIYAGLLADSSDLQSTVNQLQSSLNQVNGALNGQTTLAGIDVIGYSPPDVFTESVFATSGNFPFQKSGRYLKGLDSYIIQGYYIETTTTSDGTSSSTEYIQNYNVSDGTDGQPVGLTTLGKKASASLPDSVDPLYDYILPLAITDTKG